MAILPKFFWQERRVFRAARFFEMLARQVPKWRGHKAKDTASPASCTRRRTFALDNPFV